MSTSFSAAATPLCCDALADMTHLRIMRRAMLQKKFRVINEGNNLAKVSNGTMREPVPTTSYDAESEES